MSKSTNPWKRLDVLRRKIGKLEELKMEMKSVRAECLAWLGVAPTDLLTRRETEILVMIQDNPTFRNKDIANRLNVSERAVKYHITNLFRKYGVATKKDLLHVGKGQENLK